jgi:citronellol/citronellal dehydrogenase
MFQKELFKGKTALVTGGGSGIGFEIAKQLLGYGAEVHIASRKDARLDEALGELKKFGDCKAFALDIRDTQKVEQLAEFIGNQSGKLDILVNNAGGQFPSPAEDISPNGWQAVVNTNLNGTWFVTQTMAKKFFFPQKEGVVVNIIVNHLRGVPGMSHTGAARAGVDNLTKSLAIEWVNRNIRLNCVAPGIIQSSGLAHYPPVLVAQVSKAIPMKRFGTTEEVANLVLFLASPMASYITGETVYIDGGARLWGDVWEIE